MPYREKPRIIDAWQYEPAFKHILIGWVTEEGGNIYPAQGTNDLVLETLEGPERVSPNDYVIFNSDKTFDLMTEKDFEAKYEWMDR